ncbi:MAG: U32 family peptidase [Candidatus Omnitrophica bacterium]|nr:U32 family peptidase [Candidatus Omnitrophota bacterium]
MKNNSHHKPELLAPAGNWPALQSAVANGADSVYFGVRGLNMRASAGNFEASELRKVMQLLRDHGKKGFLALNTILLEHQTALAGSILDEAANAGVDAVILWDMGALAMAQERGLTVHLSTQASAANSQAVRFFQRAGVKRVVLARECTLEHIERLKQQLRQTGTACELEIFVHGAMCLAVSGRCFMSLYAHGQSANQGACTQPCRREYEIHAKAGEEEFLVEEDHVLSPKDLCAIDFLDQLIGTGVDSLKIEGRMRSPEYAATVTRVYRRGIDAVCSGQWEAGLRDELKAQLSSVYNRGFSSGFYFGEPDPDKSRRLEHTHEKIYVGEVRKYYAKISVADVLLHNDGLRTGTDLLIFGKQTPASTCTVEELQQDHRVVNAAGRGQHVGIKIPFAVKKGDRVFLWRKKDPE